MSKVEVPSSKAVPLPPRKRFMANRDQLLGAATIVALLVIWDLVYRFELMPPWAFPSPLQVVVALYELSVSGVLLENTLAAARRAPGVMGAAEARR